MRWKLSPIAPSRPPQFLGSSAPHSSTLAAPYHNYVSPDFGEFAWNGTTEAVTIFNDIASLVPMARLHLAQVLGAIKVSMNIVNNMHQHHGGYHDLMEHILRRIKPLAEQSQKSRIDSNSDTAANLYILEWYVSNYINLWTRPLTLLHQ